MPGQPYSLGEMFDHVGIAVADLDASERFYRTVLSALGAEPSHADAELVEWEDWAIGPTDREHPVTRGLHVGFRAPTREAVDAFWQAGIDAGFRDDGAPGTRAIYGPDYYGGFLLDPDGNSAEAVHGERARPAPDGPWREGEEVWVFEAKSALVTSDRHYKLLALIGTQPRTTYLGRIRNTNPAMSSKAMRRPTRSAPTPASRRGAKPMSAAPATGR